MIWWRDKHFGMKTLMSHHGPAQKPYRLPFLPRSPAFTLLHRPLLFPVMLSSVHPNSKSMSTSSPVPPLSTILAIFEDSASGKKMSYVLNPYNVVLGWHTIYHSLVIFLHVKILLQTEGEFENRNWALYSFCLSWKLTLPASVISAQ